jgi:hypothetical protein
MNLAQPGAKRHRAVRDLRRIHKDDRDQEIAEKIVDAVGTERALKATEITFDIGDKAIECLGRPSAAVELAARRQLRLGCLVRAATSRFR